MLNIDKTRVAQRFAKAGQSYTEHAVVQKKICQQLLTLMLNHLPQRCFNQTFEMGCGSGNLSHLLMQNFEMKHCVFNDLYPQVKTHFSNLQNIEWLIGDVEQLDFPQSLDLITSSSALQWMSHIEHIFKKCYEALIPDAYFCFSTFGPHNLTEIKALTGQGLSYLNIEEIQEKMTAQNFEILHLSEHIETLTFPHPKYILQHLKATGVTATASKHRWTKQSLQKFYQDYQQFSQINQAGECLYTLSYHPIYCIARSKS